MTARRLTAAFFFVLVCLMLSAASLSAEEATRRPRRRSPTISRVSSCPATNGKWRCCGSCTGCTTSNAGPLIPLWDEWMPMSTLWPARGDGAALGAMRRRWAGALAGRVINAEGYVHTQQHDGPAHAEGWPFPLWTQAGGIGWHFAPLGVPGYEAPRATPDGWKLVGATAGALVEQGLAARAVHAGREHPVAAVCDRRADRPLAAAELVGRGPRRGELLRRVDHERRAGVRPERRAYFSPAAAGGGAPRLASDGRQRRQDGPLRRRNPHDDPRLPRSGLEGHDHRSADRLRQRRPGAASSSSRSTPPATRGTTSTTSTSSAAATTTSSGRAT